MSTVYPSATRKDFAIATRFAKMFGSPLIEDNLGDIPDYAADYFLHPEDSVSGYAITADGELVNVFSLVRGRGDDLVTDAIRNGARHLDAFEGYLTELYGRHGFVEYRREANWTPGGPDVVYMKRESTQA